MNTFRNSLKKINAELKNNKLSHRGNTIPLNTLFKVKRNSTRLIPKPEDELKTILKTLNYRFNRAGSIWINNKFYSMTWFRNQLKLVPLNKRAPTISGVFEFNYNAETPEELKTKLTRFMKTNTNYFVNIKNDSNESMRLTRVPVLNKTSKFKPFYELFIILERILERPEEYDISTSYIIVQLHREITTNPALEEQKDGDYNCACKIVLDELKKNPTERNQYKIKHVERINEKYFNTGINNEGLQELSIKTEIKLVIKDRIGEIWHEFIPNTEPRKTLLLVSHNNHISVKDDDMPYDEDDEDNTNDSMLYDSILLSPMNFNNVKVKGQTELWFKTNDMVIKSANEYEARTISDGNFSSKEGIPIISRGNLVAYITPEVIYKTEFYEHMIYPECFTSGGVGKGKFVEQHPEYKYGITDEDPFYSLLMDANRSGFYSRTGGSSENHTKYDQNQSYRSFDKSGIFNGFPIIEAIFKIDKPFSDLNDISSMNLSDSKGLLYVEVETLTKENLDKKIYFEASGWYPFEIVKYYFEKHNQNPLVKSWAYASETFNVDFSDFSKDQFRTFIGKCVSKTYDEVWRTKDYSEFMRARYLLRERIINIRKDRHYYSGESHDIYQITYESDKKPWNMPVISAYVKAHQKYNIFQQYNKLIDNDILPVAVSVDGIEIREKRDDLFSIGKKNGQWKLEKIYTQGSIKPSVIERTIPEPQGTVCYDPKYILPKYFHISGAGGNGKTEFIKELGEIYPKTMFMAPTSDAVKNLLDRGVQQADTYHKVFGFGCPDRFPRHKYTKFILDECSMLSAENLRIIMSKLNNQSLIMAGDFWQLQTVHGTPIYNNWTGKCSNEYKLFETRELTKNWRQKEDPKFFSLCSKLRGKLSKKKALDVLKLLNTRVVKTLPENTTTDDIHICGINAQVDRINRKFKLEVGTKVISNIHCKDLEGRKIPNGAIGVIESMSPLKINFNGVVSTFIGIGKNKSGKPRFTPAYGLTVHKAQGKTIKRHVIINPSRLFAKNHLYVALTRAVKFDSIYLTKKMDFKTFCKTVFVKGHTVVPKSNRRKGLVARTKSA